MKQYRAMLSDKRVLPLLCMLLGAVLFVLLYGTLTLDVTNDTWILNGYDESDIVQRYAGWVNYRNAPWTFPLAHAETMAAPDGVTISFMDSLPLVAVLFKAVSFALPQTFQFEGVYMLLCFMLQGLAAGLLLRRVTEKPFFVLAGSVFFILAPVLLERGFRHSTLASHYFILFAMYLYLEHRRSGRLPWQFFVLSVCGVGITPYFLPMVMIFVLLTCIDAVRVTKRALRPLGFFAGNAAAAMALAWVLGSVGHGVTASRDGYGYYSANLNALINPMGKGEYVWSNLFLRRGWAVDGQYDGFLYLGAGALLLVTLLAIYMGVRLCAAQSKAALCRSWLSRNGACLAACLFLTAFAVTHIVTWDGVVLFTIPLPQMLISLCGIFRASSRLFYPVYYLVMLYGLTILYRVLAGRGAQALLAVFLAVQLFDLSPVLLAKHSYMTSGAATDLSAAKQGFVDLTSGLGRTHTRAVRTVPHHVDNAVVDRYLMVLLGKEGMAMNLYDTNSGVYPAAEAVGAAAAEQLARGEYDAATVYITYDAAEYDVWQRIFANDNAVRLAENDGAYFLIPAVVQ